VRDRCRGQSVNNSTRVIVKSTRVIDKKLLDQDSPGTAWCHNCREGWTVKANIEAVCTHLRFFSWIDATLLRARQALTRHVRCYNYHNNVGRFINSCKKRRPPLKTINFIIDALDPYFKITNNLTKEPLWARKAVLLDVACYRTRSRILRPSWPWFEKPYVHITASDYSMNSQSSFDFRDAVNPYFLAVFGPANLPVCGFCAFFWCLYLYFSWKGFFAPIQQQWTCIKIIKSIIGGADPI